MIAEYKIFFRPAGFIVLLLCAGSACGQSTFKSYVKAAYDSSINERYAGAISLLRQAVSLKGKDTGYNESVNLYLANNFEALNKIDSCIFYYGEAIKYYENKKEFASLSFIYNRLGSVEIKFTKRFPKAITYFKKQAAAITLQKDSTGYFDCLNNLGIAYKYLERYDSALFYFKAVLDDHSERNTSRNRALLLSADIYSLEKDYGRALAFYDAAIAGLTPVNDSTDIFIAWLNKGDCLMQQDRFKESLDCFSQARRFINDAISGNDKKEFYHNLAYVYSRTGEYAKAFYFKEKESDIKDSINTESIQEAAADADAKYETRINRDSLVISRQNLALATNESRQRQQRFLVMLIAAVAVSCLAFVAFRNAALRKKANEKLAVEKVKAEALAADLAAANEVKARLFSVISHDLRSPVSSLYSFLKMKELKVDVADSSAMIGNGILHLLDTLEDLLIWSKSQMDRFTLQPVYINTKDLCSEITTLYAETAALRNVLISTEGVESCQIFTDENILKIILRNVLMNAVSYAPPNTTVTLKASGRDTGITLSVTNAISAEDFIVLKSKLNDAAPEGGTKGLGNILIREFAEKIHANVALDYAGEAVSLSLSIPRLQAS